MILRKDEDDMKMYEGLDSWNPPMPEIDDSSIEQLLAAALNWAILAPSSHNTQPWKFQQEPDAVCVVADRSKRLHFVDPHDRELLMSCAAATAHLELALMRFGLAVQIDWLPDGDEADVVARVSVLGHREPTNDELLLFNAITTRATNRAPFRATQVPVTTLVQAKHLAESSGAHLTVFTGSDRVPVADLVAQGDQIQMADKDFRYELAAWLHHNRTDELDGIRGYAFGLGDLASHMGPTVIRTFDAGRGQGARDHELATHSPALFVIATDRDTPHEWVRAGRALDRILLQLTAEGYAASFLNQPIEVPELRPKLAQMLRPSRFPQILLRVGEPTEQRPREPRRPATFS